MEVPLWGELQVAVRDIIGALPKKPNFYSLGETLVKFDEENHSPDILIVRKIGNRPIRTTLRFNPKYARRSAMLLDGFTIDDTQKITTLDQHQLDQEDCTHDYPSFAYVWRAEEDLPDTGRLRWMKVEITRNLSVDYTVNDPIAKIVTAKVSDPDSLRGRKVPRALEKVEVLYGRTIPWELPLPATIDELMVISGIREVAAQVKTHPLIPFSNHRLQSEFFDLIT